MARHFLVLGVFVNIALCKIIRLLFVNLCMVILKIGQGCYFLPCKRIWRCIQQCERATEHTLVRQVESGSFQPIFGVGRFGRRR